MTMEERLDRLEKQNRNLRRVLAGVLLLVLVVPLALLDAVTKSAKKASDYLRTI